jgi:sec-independent protein translocase protein TatB
MFGFSWAEIALIMAVALIAIGPKDLPVAIRTVTTMMKKARAMAAEFQGHVDEMMREANLADVKTEINKLRRFDFKGAAETTIDPDGSLRAVMTDKPAIPAYAAPAFIAPAPVVEVAEASPAAPAFIPPDAARKPRVPDFIPPGTRRWGY